MEKELSKSQIRLFMALGAQKAQIEQAYNDILESEREQITILAKHYSLPDGEYKLRQVENGSVFLVSTTEE